MNKRKTYILLATLGLLPILFALCFLPFLPDEVITHMWITTPDSYGPKWRMLLVPGLLLTVGNAIFFGIYAFNKNKEERGVIAKSKVSLFSIVGFMVLFDAIGLIILIMNLNF